VGPAAVAHSDAGSHGSLLVEEVPTSPATASILSLRFDPAQGLPPQDAMTTPLLRLMLATDDVRLSQRLFLETSERLRAAAPGVCSSDS